MSDLISRKEAIEWFEKRINGTPMPNARAMFKYALDAIRSRKTGKWVEHGISEGFLIEKYTCSECDYYAGNNKEMNYCPNCGADMRGEE